MFLYLHNALLLLRLTHCSLLRRTYLYNYSLENDPMGIPEENVAIKIDKNTSNGQGTQYGFIKKPKFVCHLIVYVNTKTSIVLF